MFNSGRCVMLWYLTRALRNKLAHVLHGNTVSKSKTKTWRRKHFSDIRSQLSIGTLNVNGFSDSIKQTAIHDLDLDVLGISETHLQHHLHRAFSEQFRQYHCVFSNDPPDRHFKGVALFLKKSCFWQVKTVQWQPDDPCYKFWQDGRLIAVQAWYGHGGNSLLLYSIYAPSGSRWETPKRKVFNQMLDSLVQDQVSRGQLPTVVLGDLNMTIPESLKFQGLLRDRQLIDVRSLADASMLHEPTCFAGSTGGSCIDYILSSSSLIDLFSNFKVEKVPAFKDHALVTAKLSVTAPIQTRLSLRKATEIPSLRSPEPQEPLIPCQIDQSFSHSLAIGQLDEAYLAITNEIDRVLKQVAEMQGHNVPHDHVPKGQIRFQSQRRHPKAIDSQASTLCSRKLYKAINQALEVTRCQPGYRRDRTWHAIPSSLKMLSTEHYAQVKTLLEGPASIDNAQIVVKLLSQQLDATIRHDKSERILKWKQKIRSAQNEQHKWLRNRSKTQLQLL